MLVDDGVSLIGEGKDRLLYQCETHRRPRLEQDSEGHITKTDGLSLTSTYGVIAVTQAAPRWVTLALTSALCLKEVRDFVQ